MLHSELEVHLGRNSDGVTKARAEAGPDVSPSTKYDTSRPNSCQNRSTPKTIQGDMGKLPLDIPRDRNGAFASQLEELSEQ